MFFKKEYLDYNQVLMLPKRSSLASRKDANVVRHYYYKRKEGDYINKCGSFLSSPIIIANMDCVGTLNVAKTFTENNVPISVALGKDTDFSEYDPAVHHNTFMSIGLSDNMNDRLLLAKEKGIHKICLDVANGYTEIFLSLIAKVRAWSEMNQYPLYIMAGNICTPDIIGAYAVAGASCVKVGIGPGAVCRTRITAGIGMPQFTAVKDCVKQARKFNLDVCADGGVSEPADAAKAIALGADWVMMGTMWAGHDETADEFYDETNTHKVFYGMSSNHAMNARNNRQAHRASEGRVVKVPYKGSLLDTAGELLGSIRSTMTYTNTKEITDLPKNTKFIRVNDVINRKMEANTIGI